MIHFSSISDLEPHLPPRCVALVPEFDLLGLTVKIPIFLLIVPLLGGLPLCHDDQLCDLPDQDLAATAFRVLNWPAPSPSVKLTVGEPRRLWF